MSNEYGNDYISLVDENGVETEFEHIDTVEMDDETYVALVPVYDDPQEAVEADGELLILKVVPDDDTGEDILATIEDDEEYEHVSKILMKRLEDYYDVEN